MKVDAPTVLPFAPASSLADRRARRKGLLQSLRFSRSSLILDCSGCSTLNHEDIGLLLECLAQVTGRDTEVLLVAGSPVNRVLLEVTRISSVVPVFNSVAEALAPQALAENEKQDLRTAEYQTGSA